MTRPDGAATVVAVAGRRIDTAGSIPRRFPLANAARVRDAISSILTALRASVVLSSAACGTDLLAAEAASALGIRRRVILPFAASRFRDSSVADRPGDWGPIFDALIADVDARGDLRIIGDGREADEAYAETNVAILDEGDALAASTHAARVALIAWEGASRGPGDLTDQFRSHATSRGWRIEEVPTL